MSKFLVIVESPSKTKKVSSFLGPDYKVMSSVGHIRDLPKNNKKAIDIENDFKTTYEISSGKQKVISELKQAAKEAKEVFLAPDPDREGEAIAWHLKETLNLKNPKRVTFNEITKEAVLEAFDNTRGIDTNLFKAQEARRVLDRLVGYDLSGLIWKKVRYGLSAGRVQSPALRIIMEREREIRAFIPEAYYNIFAHLTDGSKEYRDMIFNCSIDINDKNVAENIVKKAYENKNFYVKDIEITEVKRSAKAPFITSTLQQTASTRLGFSPSRTMRAAQKLYEQGHITYMRTDSTTLSKQALSSIASFVDKKYGNNYLEVKNFTSKNKNAQEAHEAIRPSDIYKTFAGNTDDEKRLYSLIHSRTLASQMKDARIERTKIITNLKDANDFPNFNLNGSHIIFEGWLKADPDSQGDEVSIPALKVNQTLDFISMESIEKFTEPPSRYTEAGLIKELDKRGIGRPSTFASIINTLEEREYVIKQGRTLMPTDVGDVVSTFLENNFKDYISDSFTSNMENDLDEIANGKETYEKLLRSFYNKFKEEVKQKSTDAKITTLGENTEFKCPKCHSDMNIKLSRGGKFLSCSKYPDCDGALMIDGTELKKDEAIGNDEITGLPIFVKNGRFGPYVQLGEKSKDLKKPRMASIPKEYNISTLTISDAMKFLSLPRILGLRIDKETGLEGQIIANKGRFGPYIGFGKDFRSIKSPDDVFNITLERAIEILDTPKKPKGFQKKNK